MPPESTFHVKTHLQLGPCTARVEASGSVNEFWSQETFHRRLGSLICEVGAFEEDLEVSLVGTDEDWPRQGRTFLNQLTALSGPSGWSLQRADLDASLSLSEATIRGECAPRLQVLEECLRILLWLELTGSNHKGIMVHSACTVRNNKAYCFPAYGGTGKSTLAASTPGDLPLNDEISILTCKDHQWYAWPTPFWNWPRQIRPNTEIKPYPLAGVCFLNQSPTTRLDPLRSDEALTRLMQQAIAFEAFPLRSGRTFEYAADLVQEMQRSKRLGLLHLLKEDDPYDKLPT